MAPFYARHPRGVARVASMGVPVTRRQWRREFGGSLKSLIEDSIVQSGFGVYSGTAELKDGPLRVLPLKKFLTELAAGHVLH
jgi:hypothetical protein